MTNDKHPVREEDPWNEGSIYPERESVCLELKEGVDGRPEFPFDLEERTAKFGEAIIRVLKKMPQNPVNNRIIDQLAGCGTSVGGNYCEADEAASKKEFINKIGTRKKEAKET